MRPTDDLQIRIMRELVSPGSLRWDIRESYAAMARRGDAMKKTVLLLNPVAKTQMLTRKPVDALCLGLGHICPGSRTRSFKLYM